MSLSALKRCSIFYRNAIHTDVNIFHQRISQRSFAEVMKQESATASSNREQIPQHLIRKKGRRQMPAAYIKVLKQVPPRHKDRLGQGIIAFVFLFTFGVNGIYMWQAYTLRDRLKAEGAIDGSNDERWSNVSTYRNN